MTIGVLDKDGNPQTISTADDVIALIGAVVASPVANTMQDRLKTVATLLSALTTANHTDLAAIATLLTTQASYLDGLETLLAAATPAGELHIGEVGGNTAVAGGSFTRPADTTTYASGDLIANSTTAGSVAPIPCAVARKNAGTGVISGVRLSKSSNSLANVSFRVHLFKTAPTSSAGDNAAFAGAITGVGAVALGYVDITMDQQYSDGAKGFASINAKAFDAAAGSQNIYALIEARAAYTPASGETFTLALEALRD